jgi:hypothetical protein
MISLSLCFHVPLYNHSLVTAIRLKAKQNFRTVVMFLLYIIQKIIQYNKLAYYKKV